MTKHCYQAKFACQNYYYYDSTPQDLDMNENVIRPNDSKLSCNITNIDEMLDPPTSLDKVDWRATQKLSDQKERMHMSLEAVT